MLTLLLANPLARKISAAALILLALWYVGRLMTNHAYEQGKQAGAAQAWQQAEKSNQDLWKQIKAELDRQYADLAASQKALAAERESFEKQRAVAAAKRTEQAKATEEKVKEVEKVAEEAPREEDGLPTKAVLSTLVNSYKAAYESAVAQMRELTIEVDQADQLHQKEIALKNQEIATIKADLEQAKKKADFYEEAFHGAIQKKGGFGHFLKKVLTLGIAR